MSETTADSEIENTAGKKMVTCMRNLGYIQKDKKNKHFDYAFLSEEAVKKRVQAELIAVGLCVETTLEVMMGDVSNIIVKATIQFVDPYTLDSIIVEGLGQGKDNGDKAVMKAQTAAVREAYKNAFCIPSGTDPEGDPATDKPATKKRAAPKKAAAPAVKLLTEDEFEDKMNLIGAHASDCTDLSQLDKSFVGLEKYKSSEGVSSKTTTMYKSMVKFVQDKREELENGE